MIALSERQQIVSWIEEAHAAGARRNRACVLLGITLRTLQRWRQWGEVSEDGRCTRTMIPANKLSDQERRAVLSVANSAEFAALARRSVGEAFNHLQYEIQDEVDVHRVVLSWRAWAMADFCSPSSFSASLRSRFADSMALAICLSRSAPCCGAGRLPRSKQRSWP